MLPILLTVLVAQPSPSPSPPPCFRDAQGALLKDGPYPNARKGLPPYYAVVEMHLNADDSVAWVNIYKSSGTADYDRDALAMAHQLLTLPEIAHCKHVESTFFYLHYPPGYTEPQFTPHP
ncbi:MAG TPA: energy transducer TonB [Candidatus Cybelea sp.]|jgi:TonB family protein|nr:energy transducer TonB [Candidatus Cybelea sp.]